MKFTKMHGCGNDYIYINGFQEKVPQESKKQLAIELSDRHFGIGSDGIIFINPCEIADFEMEMYNADGSRAEMCGNGIRCVGKYVYDNKMTGKTNIEVASCGQIKHLEMEIHDHEVTAVKVDMGKPEFAAEHIPVVTNNEMAIEEPITVDGKIYKMTCVSIGNPHAVVQVEDVENLAIEEIGPLFECHERFPRRINTEFIKVLDRNTVQMRVWERGSGETLACGSGCCAVTAACVVNGLTDEAVTVKLLGGELFIQWDRQAERIYMTGPAATVFHGEIDKIWD